MLTVTNEQGAEASPWSKRERELLAVTLTLLQEHGCDRLTVDAVATTARASKATVYRRWPSKGELVVAACIEGFRHAVVAPNTGTLREDLLRIGEMTCERLARNCATMTAIIPAVSRSPELNEVVRRELVDRQQSLMLQVLDRAVERGEIDSRAVNDELWDLLPGYLLTRFLFPVRPQPSRHTVEALVDGVLLPSLERFAAPHAGAC
jgi:AcrR family transcriptional regulator